MEPIPPLPALDQLLSQAADLVGTPAVVGAGLAVLVVVALRDWRAVLAAFMLLTICLGLLTAAVLPPEWGLLRVITGGFVAIIWYLSAQRAGWGGRFLPFQSQSLAGVRARPLSSTNLFRLLLVLALAVLLLAVRPRLPLPPLPPDIRLVVTWMAAFALLSLALGEEALQVGTALLIWLAAAQLMLAALRQDAWLLWLLSTVELLAALATGYLMVAQGRATLPEPEEEVA